MSGGRRGARGRSRIRPNRSRWLKSDTNLTQYLSFFCPTPVREDSTASWGEAHFLDGEKISFGPETDQEVEIQWDSNQMEKAMDDHVIVVDDDKVPSYASIGSNFGQTSGGSANSKRPESESDRFLSDCGSHSFSSGPVGSARLSSDSFSDATSGRTNGGAKQTCVICGGIANGYHFGALSCAACNAFFRRSVAESRKYFCRKTGHCIVDQSARCFCRACRLAKCLECGMDPNSVQPHRDMIGQKRKRVDDGHRTDSENSGVSLETTFGSDFKSDDTTDALCNSAKDFSNKRAKLEDPKSQVIPDEPTVSSDVSTFNPAFVQRVDDSSKRSKFCDSTTAHLLTSTNFIAESLLAFSRTPLIAATCEDVPLVRANGVAYSQPPTHFSEATLPAATIKIASMLADSNSSIHANALPLLSHLADGKSIFSNQSSRCGFKQTVPIERDHARSPSLPKTDYNASKNCIEALLHAYSRLVELRRLLFNRGNLRDLLSGRESPLRRIEVGSVMSSFVKLDFGLVIDFFNNFHPFSKLRLDDRVILMKNAVFPFFTIERHYTTMRNGGLQANRLVNVDNSFYDLASSDADDDSDEAAEEKEVVTGKGNENAGETTAKVEKRAVRKLLIPLFRDMLKDIAGGMYHSGMTDVEFVALVYIILLDQSVQGLSDVARRLLKDARDNMYRDWFAYYEAHNISDGAQRVGNALLLLPAVGVAAKQYMEAFHMIRVFKYCDIPRVFDDLFME